MRPELRLSIFGDVQVHHVSDERHRSRCSCFFLGVVTSVTSVSSDLWARNEKTRNVTFLFFPRCEKMQIQDFFFYCCYYGVEGLSCSRFVGDGCVYVYIITAVCKVFIYLKLNR